MKINFIITLAIVLITAFGCQRGTSDPLNPLTDSLSIVSFTPVSAHIGDTIKIKGKGFDPTGTGNLITINSVQQIVLAGTDSIILMKVAPNTTTGKILLKARNMETISSVSLEVIPLLSILTLSPAAAYIGDTITIKGTGFSPSAPGNVITIHNTPAQVIMANDSVLKIKILPATTSGSITIVANGQTSTSAGILTILDHEIWTRKQDFPFSWAGSLYLNGNGFVNGFSSATRGYYFKSSKLWEYDPLANTWASKPNLPVARIKNFTFSFTIGTKAYIGLGAESPGDVAGMTKEVWEYDMANSQWTRKNDFPGSARVMPFSFSINGNGYVGGGDISNTGTQIVKDVWQYNPMADAWIRVADFPVAQIGMTGFQIGNTGYVLEAGQGNPTAPAGNLTSVRLWSYDSATNIWLQKASLPTTGRTVNSATVFSTGGKAYAAIGANDSTMVNGVLVKNDFWEYNPVTNTWTKRTDVGGQVRWWPASFSIGNKGYVGLGNGTFYTANHTDFWQYTPE
jgi:N-acetylneuraminic acid mutarotase